MERPTSPVEFDREALFGCILLAAIGLGLPVGLGFLGGWLWGGWGAAIGVGLGLFSVALILVHVDSTADPAEVRDPEAEASPRFAAPNPSSEITAPSDRDASEVRAADESEVSDTLALSGCLLLLGLGLALMAGLGVYGDDRESAWGTVGWVGFGILLTLGVLIVLGWWLADGGESDPTPPGGGGERSADEPPPPLAKSRGEREAENEEWFEPALRTLPPVDDSPAADGLPGDELRESIDENPSLLPDRASASLVCLALAFLVTWFLLRRFTFWEPGGFSLIILAPLSYRMCSYLFLMTLGPAGLTRRAYLGCFLLTYLSAIPLSLGLDRLAHRLVDSDSSWMALFSYFLVLRHEAREFWPALIGHTFGTGLLEESIKLLPVVICIATSSVRSRRAAALAAAISGVGFGLIEALWYANRVYLPLDAPVGIFLLRFFASVPSHALLSAIAGFLLYEVWRRDRPSFTSELGSSGSARLGRYGPRWSLQRYALGGMAAVIGSSLLHGLNNAFATVGSMVGPMLVDLATYVGFVVVVVVGWKEETPLLRRDRTLTDEDVAKPYEMSGCSLDLLVVLGTGIVYAFTLFW